MCVHGNNFKLCLKADNDYIFLVILNEKKAAEGNVENLQQHDFRVVKYCVYPET